jgi:hypothetical protein
MQYVMASNAIFKLSFSLKAHILKTFNLLFCRKEISDSLKSNPGCENETEVALLLYQNPDKKYLKQVTYSLNEKTSSAQDKYPSSRFRKFFTAASRTAPIQCVPGVLSLGGKAAGA